MGETENGYKPEDLFEERPEVLEKVKKNQIAVLEFWGQTILHLPLTFGTDIDIEGIKKIVDEVYGERLNNFSMTIHKYKNSWEIVVPPLIINSIDENGLVDRDRKQLDEFIAKLKERYER